MKKFDLNSLLSLQSKLWIFFGACIAAVGGLGYMFYTQQFHDYAVKSKEFDSQIEIKKSELRQILAQKQRLKDLEAEIDQANQEFIRLQEMFPDQEVIPKRLIDLTAVTRRSQTIPTKFLPLQSEEKEFYKENHYSVTLSSSYHGLGSLLADIANFRYPTSIDKLEIEKAADLDKAVSDARDHGEIPKTITATFELTTFTSKR